MSNPNEAHDEACCCFECWQKKYPFVYIPELDIVEQEFKAQEQQSAWHTSVSELFQFWRGHPLTRRFRFGDE